MKEAMNEEKIKNRETYQEALTKSGKLIDEIIKGIAKIDDQLQELKTYSDTMDELGLVYIPQRGGSTAREEIADLLKVRNYSLRMPVDTTINGIKNIMRGIYSANRFRGVDKKLEQLPENYTGNL